MFGAVLCDLDGVLRRHVPMTTYDAQFGVPAGTLAAAAFTPDLLLPAITGRCTDGEWRVRIAETLGADVEACLFVDDTLPNVQAALAIGRVGHHYQSPDGLRGILHDHLV